MASQKISEFNVSTSLNNSDLFTFVVNGTNKNITYSSFKTELGVTGSLSQAGDPLGAPILDQNGTTYNIRNLESSKGAMASVSAQDGVAIACNFAQGTVGVPIITDLNAKQYEIKTLAEGDNISIQDHGNHIEIAFVPETGSTKTVIVSQESDFPEAVLGVITLEPLTKYLLIDDVTTANRFVLQDRTVISGDSAVLSALHYTGSGTMFTWLDATVVFDNLRINAPVATLFSGTSPGNPLGAFIIERCTIDNCDTIGSFGDMFAVRWDNATFFNVTSNGILLLGNIDFLGIDSSFINELAGTLFDLGTSTFDGLTIINSVIITSGSATLLTGLPNSGNVNTGGIGTIVNNRSKGTLNIVNIGPDDALWNFALNDNIPDTRPDSLLSFTSPTTTVLAAATPAIINGTWTIERTSQMTGTTGGRVTYDGGKDAVLPITVTLSIEPVSGTNKDVNIYLAKNGSVVSNSQVITVISSGSPKNQSIAWQDSFSTGDYYEIFIESVDGTDLQVNTAKLRVN